MRIEEEIQRRNLGPTHPAVATMIAFAIAMVLLAIFCTHPAFQDDPEEVTPTVGATVSFSGPPIQIEKVDPSPVDILDVRYVLLDDTGRPVPSGQGDLVDLLNADLDLNETYLSYYDADRDENISSGDTIIVKKHTDGGIARSYHHFLLIYIPTGEKMNGGGTRLG